MTTERDSVEGKPAEEFATLTVDSVLSSIESIPQGDRTVAALSADVIAFAASLEPRELATLRAKLKTLRVTLKDWDRLVEQEARECRQGTREAAEAWKQRLIYDDDGGLRNVAANAITILANDLNWRGILAWDEFRQEIVFRRAPSWCEDDAPAGGTQSRDLDDRSTVRLQSWLMRRYGLNLGKESVMDAAWSVASVNTFNSAKEELENVEWDGKSRLDHWLCAYLGARNTPFVAFAGRAFLISAVARVYDPGVQADYVLILEGDQDLGKSSSLRALFGEHFSETPLDLDSKDRFVGLRGIMCQSFDELASMMKSDQNSVKTFFTCPIDTYRPPYGRNSVRVKRQCVFAGTVNPPEGVGYLKDSTGNRRYWPILCGARGPITPEMRAALLADRRQLWAEAVVAYKAGEKWWPHSPELNALCKAEQSKREETSPWEETIEAWLSGNAITCQSCKGSGEEMKGDRQCWPCRGSGKVTRTARGEPYVTQSDVLEFCLAIPKERHPASSVKVASILVKLGWKPPADGKRVTRAGAKVTPYYEPGRAPPVDDEREEIQAEANAPAMPH